MYIEKTEISPVNYPDPGPEPLQALWMILLSSQLLTSSCAAPCAKWISTVGKGLYVNALTESERLNVTEYRSETCSGAKLTVVRPERTSQFGPRTHVLESSQEV